MIDTAYFLQGSFSVVHSVSLCWLIKSTGGLEINCGHLLISTYTETCTKYAHNGVDLSLSFPGLVEISSFGITWEAKFLKWRLNQRWLQPPYSTSKHDMIKSLISQLLNNISYISKYTNMFVKLCPINVLKLTVMICIVDIQVCTAV